MSLEQNITLDRKTIFRMLIPVLIDQLFITLLPIVNTVVVSALGQSSMSGVSIVDQINQLISFTVVAIGMGGAVMAAQYTGRGDRNGVARVVKQSYSSSFLVTIVVTVVVIVFASPIISMALSGADDEMKSIAYSYLLITCFSYPFYGFYSNTTQILRGIGRPREAMVTSVVMNTAIFVINAACIYVLELGIIGAGLATLLGRVVGAVVGYVMVGRTGAAKKPADFFTLKLEWPMQKMMLSLGVPAGMQSFFFVGARLVMNVFILPFGDDHYAANVVFTQMLDLQCTGSTVVAALAPAIMGMAKGKGDQEGIQKAFKDLNYLSFWLGAVLSFLPIPFLKQIAQLYQIVAPKFIQPILQQGIDDGSIRATNPHALAEAIMVLSNVWLNPLVSMTDEAGMRNRCETFNDLLQGVGINQFLDDKMIEGYISYCTSQHTA